MNEQTPKPVTRPAELRDFLTAGIPDYTPLAVLAVLLGVAMLVAKGRR
jgi:hypothetical protein